MSSRLAELSLLRIQADRQSAEDRQFPVYPKSGKFVAINSRTNIAVSTDPSGNISLGQPISNGLATLKSRTTSLNNGSIDFRSATSRN